VIGFSLFERVFFGIGLDLQSKNSKFSPKVMISFFSISSQKEKSNTFKCLCLKISVKNIQLLY